MAAVLWGGDESAISHTTAGRLLRLDAIRIDAVHLTLPSSIGRRTADLVLHRMALPPKDVVGGRRDSLHFGDADDHRLRAVARRRSARRRVRAGAADGTDQRRGAGAASRRALRSWASRVGSCSTLARGADSEGPGARVAARGEAGAAAAEERAADARAAVSGRPISARLRVAEPAHRLRVRRFRASRYSPRVEARPRPARGDRSGGLANRARDVGRRHPRTAIRPSIALALALGALAA